MPFWDFFGATFIGKAILKVTALLPAALVMTANMCLLACHFAVY